MPSSTGEAAAGRPPLARREAIIAFNLLLSRCPGMALSVPENALTWRPTIIMRSLESLPVRWEAE